MSQIGEKRYVVLAVDDGELYTHTACGYLVSYGSVQEARAAAKKARDKAYLVVGCYVRTDGVDDILSLDQGEV